ncbi:Leucine-rich repeat and IQ domain-containing protein 1 [Balamuthia mandrillaris]
MSTAASAPRDSKIWMVAYDGSACAEMALNHALSLARPFEDEIIVMHIYRNKEVQELGERLMAKVEKKIKDKNFAKYRIYNIESKDVRRGVCDQARYQSADYLVMGSRGLSTLQKMVMGSVSDYCVRYATCPVIIVRQKETGGVGEGGEQGERPMMTRKKSKEQKKEEKKEEKRRKKEEKKMKGRTPSSPPQEGEEEAASIGRKEEEYENLAQEKEEYEASIPGGGGGEAKELKA